MMPRTAEIRRRDKEKTRTDLLRAGERLFASHGFEGTSLDRIAADPGVNKALIAYYFKGKRGLYRAIIEENVTAVRARIEQASIDTLPPGQALQSYIHALAHAMSARPHFPAMIVREHVSSAFLDQQGYGQRDLAALFGESRASEVLSRKRPLSMKQARTLKREWDVPAEALLTE